MYGQGALAFDADGDRDLDLHLTGYGGHALALNDGRGRFSIQMLPKDSETHWSTSSAAGDLDGDGDLDLYVALYLDYRLDHGFFCERASGEGTVPEREFCDPSLFDPQKDLILAGGPDGLRRAPLMGASESGRGLGVEIVDVDGDARQDIYVANDLTPNHLLVSGPDGLEDVSLFSGAAVNADGKPEAGMGVAVLDADSDGDPDLAVTNFDVETNTLYRNDGELFFTDVASASGFGLPSFNLLGFGLLARDFDLDGAVDLFVANGHIFEKPPRENVAYGQPDLFLRGDGAGRFETVDCALLGDEKRVGRGAAAADFDHDGDLDLVVSNNGDQADLWRNLTNPESQRWIGVELLGRAPNTEALGATVRLRQGERTQTAWVTGGGSYLSSSDRRVVFGVPPGDQPVSIEISWPSGQRTVMTRPPRGHYLRVVEPSSVPPGVAP